MPKINTPPKTQITVRIAANVAQRFEAYALKTNLPKSVHAQIAFEEFLDRRKFPAPSPPPASSASGPGNGG